MKTLKAFGVAIGVAVFFAFLTGLGLAMGGAGHGSTFFAEAMMSPWSLSGLSETMALTGLASWFVVGWLLSFRRLLLCRIVTSGLLLGHYVGIVALFVRTDHGILEKTIEALFPFALLAVASYIGSQVLIWRSLLRAHVDLPARQPKASNSDVERRSTSTQSRFRNPPS